MKAIFLAAVLLVHGVVLEVEPGDRAYIHSEAFAGMPAMTMEFAFPHGTVLHPGDHITGEVDEKHQPWALSHLTVTAASTPPPIVPTPSPLALGDVVPDAKFVDQRGRPVSIASLRGRAYALTFIYSRCRDADMCPLISAKYHQVQAKLPPGTMLVEVTLDPVYDVPPVLARYGTTFGARPDRWLLLTGAPRSVLSFAQRFGIFERRVGGQSIVHTERLALVDRNGKIAEFFDDPSWPPDKLVAALRSMQ